MVTIASLILTIRRGSNTFGAGQNIDIVMENAAKLLNDFNELKPCVLGGIKQAKASSRFVELNVDGEKFYLGESALIQTVSMIDTKLFFAFLRNNEKMIIFQLKVDLTRKEEVALQAWCTQMYTKHFSWNRKSFSIFDELNEEIVSTANMLPRVRVFALCFQRRSSGGL